MTLQSRVNLILLGAFLLVLIAAAALVVRGAQQAVARELRSSTQLGVQVLETIGRASTQGAIARDALGNLVGTLEATRHLRIAVEPEGGDGTAGAGPGPTPEKERAPAWFEALVAPGDFQARHQVALGDGRRLVLRADPSDEVAEAWSVAGPLLGLIALFTALACLGLSWAIRRALWPLETVQGAISAVERGDYARRLPQPPLPELAAITGAFNRMAERLQRSDRENRHLTRRLHSIQEDERREVARELHDELGQCLTAVRMEAAAASRRAGEDSELAHHAERINDTAERMGDAVRQLTRRLWPATLETLGLTAALGETVREWQEAHPGIQCRFEVEGECDALSPEARITLFRALQEALTNVSRHAGASEVCVDLRRLGGPDRVSLVIADNGRGLDEDELGRGIGLRGMAERVAALQGSFWAGTGADGGTRVEVTVPIPGEEAATEEGSSQGPLPEPRQGLEEQG